MTHYPLFKKSHPHFKLLPMLLLLFLLLFGAFAAPVETVYAASKGTVNTQGLNLRTKASTNGAIITSLAKGTEVTITSTKTNKKKETWYKIKVSIDNITYKGYVLSTYVDKISSNKKNTTTASTTTSESTEANFVSRFGNLKNYAVLYKSQSRLQGIKAYLNKNTLVRVNGKKKIGSTTWYAVKTYGLSKNYRGYLPAKQVKYQPIKVKSTRYKIAIVKTKCGIYKTANGTDTRLGTAVKDTDVIILGTLTVGGKKWAKVKTSVGTGYIVYSYLTPVTSTVKNSTNYTGTVTKRSYTRRVASLLASNKGTAEVGTTVSILGRLTVNKVIWYKCRFTSNGATVTGYIRASSIYMSTEAIFQESLLEFPETYRPYLQALHDAHPEWIFNAVNTGLDWNTVIANETVNGKNTIQSNCPTGGAAGTYSAAFSYLSTAAGDYDWTTDTYTLRDGSNWYSANTAVVSYYMDPRNFLNDQGIYQFESLAYESTQTQEVVNTMLANTFMSGNYDITDIATGKQVTGSYSDAFMAAASASSVSPYYLISRVKNEVGNSGSGSTSGTYSGYQGYYNFYNIGANDSATGQAIANGLAWAKNGTSYNRPWTTPYKSIVGGASYIANQYIALGQNTMYTQKFNVVVPTSLFLHQYMTAVTAANSYAVSNYNAYASNNLVNNPYTFYIPVYTNMPANACALPEAKGNPNSFLKKLTVKNTETNKTISLNQTFAYNIGDYTAAVGSGVNSVTISASAISSYAKVGGTGTYALSAGNNAIKIVCTAGDGTTTTYTITIVK